MVAHRLWESGVADSSSAAETKLDISVMVTPNSLKVVLLVRVQYVLPFVHKKQTIVRKNLTIYLINTILLSHESISTNFG